MKTIMRAVVVLSILRAVSHAQSTPAADIAVEYSHLQILKGFTISMNGASGSVAFNVNHWFGVAGGLANPLASALQRLPHPCVFCKGG